MNDLLTNILRHSKEIPTSGSSISSEDAQTNNENEKPSNADDNKYDGLGQVSRTYSRATDKKQIKE